MKKFLFAFFYAAGLVRLAAWRNRRRVTILCYHGVTERAERSPDDTLALHVRWDRFAAHLDHLRRRYNVISLRECLAARRERRRLPDYSVVLTFDDGYRNFLTAAAPRLRERGLPASVFLITDRLRDDDGAARPSAWRESDDTSYLSWAEVEMLEREHGVEFGSHTCSHPKLPNISRAQAERELSASLSVVSARLKPDSVALAYPYGAYSDEVVEQARTLGYACALTTDAGPNDAQTDLFALRRTLIGDDDDEASFAARVSGLTSWLASALAPLRSLVGSTAQAGPANARDLSDLPAHYDRTN
ncbi:MAG TPA: polysaccharide deacetylase family protein [Pyrinomonadaceae bacterium]|nr:polysaccharide deacetylase family protein [Pyrinomonadaceae bacterium]